MSAQKESKMCFPSVTLTQKCASISISVYTGGVMARDLLILYTRKWKHKCIIQSNSIFLVLCVPLPKPNLYLISEFEHLLQYIDSDQACSTNMLLMLVETVYHIFYCVSSWAHITFLFVNAFIHPFINQFSSPCISITTQACLWFDLCISQQHCL